MPGLSERESQFLAQAAKGLQDKEIAAGFGLHPKTVSNTLSSAYRKLDVTNRRDAVRRFLGSDYPREPVPISQSVEPPHDGIAPTANGEAIGGDYREMAKRSEWGARYREPPKIGGTHLPIVIGWTVLGMFFLTIAFGFFAVYHLASRPVAEQSISSKDTP